MLGDEFGLPNWESKIRYLVQAHRTYRHVTRRTEPETADIVFHDQGKNLEFQFSQSRNTVSDVFPDWYPPWYQNSGNQSQVMSSSLCFRYHSADRPKPPLKWLFEVKTTLGPCETDFYMSPNQYNLVSEMHECSSSTFVVVISGHHPASN